MLGEEDDEPPPEDGEEATTDGGDVSPIRFHDVFEEKIEDLNVKRGGLRHIPISGNLYMYRFLSHFGEDSGLFQQKAGPFVVIGLGIIIIVQVTAPVVVLVSALQDIKFTNSIVGVTSFSRCSEFNFFGQRFLGFIFLVLFIMSGMYSLENDRKETQKLTELNLLFKREARDHEYRMPMKLWLWLGACINSFCLLACSIAMCFIFVIEEGPKDVVLDAFAISFLYNLDDIGGTLAFLDEQWDEDFIGDMYGEMADTESLLVCAQKFRKNTWTPDNIYKTAEWIMWVMLFLLPLVFVFVDMVPIEDDRRLGDIMSTQELSQLSETTVADFLQYIRATQAGP